MQTDTEILDHEQYMTDTLRRLREIALDHECDCERCESIVEGCIRIAVDAGLVEGDVEFLDM